MSLSTLLIGHVVHERRLHQDLIAAGQSNLVELKNWEWFVWDFHPSISIGLTLLGLGYIWLIGPARRRWELGPPVARAQKVYFWVGLILLELSLDGPVHHLADNYLFSVHMFQHLIITLITPLLLLAGIPGWAWDQILHVPVVGGMFRWMVRPVQAFLIYNGVLVIFHLPDAYGATMVDHNIHILEHLLFMASAMLVWWPILSRSEKMPPLSYGAQLIYLLIMSFPMKVLGAVITVKEDVLYGFYAAAPRVWGLTAAGDQRLGGLMMWLPAGLVLWFLAGRAFVLWWRADHAARLASKALAPLLVVACLAGCQAKPSEPAPVVAPEAAVANKVLLKTKAGLFTVRVELPKDLDMRRMFAVKVHLTDAAGEPVKQAKMTLDVTMPEHRHGMMTQPKPAVGMVCDAQGMCRAEDGVYDFDGFRLHMPGSWLWTVVVKTASGEDQGSERFEF